MTREAAIFDVDGTLCATRSTTSLIWHRARQRPAWRHRLWLGSLIWRAPLALATDRVNRGAADAMVYRQFAGLSEERVLADAELCCAKLLIPTLYSEAMAEIAHHRSAGRRILLLSGGLDVVLAPLARHLSADLLAQTLEVEGGRFTGAYRTYPAVAAESASTSQAQRKAIALKTYAERTGVDLTRSYAYGDSINDAGMLAEVGHAIAVNPDKALRRLAVARGWSIREWERG